MCCANTFGPLRWRHNEHNSVSNHQPHDCLLNRLSDADQRKHQSSASLAFVRGIHRGPVNSPHKWPVTRKMFPFDDVIMHPMVTRVYTTHCRRPLTEKWLYSLSVKTFLPPNPLKSRSREIWCCNDRIALKCVSHFGRAAADVPCQISERLHKFKPESCGIENSLDLAVRRPSAWWIVLCLWKIQWTNGVKH